MKPITYLTFVLISAVGTLAFSASFAVALTVGVGAGIFGLACNDYATRPVRAKIRLAR